MPGSPAKRILPALFGLLLTALCLLLSAGTLDWPNAYALLLLNLFASLASAAATARHPDLLAERAKVQSGSPRDKLLIAVGVLLGPVSIWISAGLEFRLHPAPLAPLPVAAGLFLAALGALLVSSAIAANRFFSSVIRIQSDRGHHVVDSGPYRLLRHPGYAGMTLVSLATPLILESSWAWLPALVTALANATRTALEDETLLRDLPGYQAYAARVPSKLLPPLW